MAHNKKGKETVGRQATLRFNSDGSVRNFTYDANVQRENICRLIVSNEIPLSFGEFKGFIEHNQTASPSPTDGKC